jgi:ADP-L-glycero-D-manno-heptose 6-epimerase
MFLITGAAGFIGSRIVRRLNSRGHNELILVDNLDRVDKLPNVASTQFADFLDKRELLEALENLPKVDAVIHQGACSATTEADGVYLMRNNHAFSRQLFEWAVNRGIPFVYASSASVYGDGARGFREKPECEQPLNLYAFSKLAFDNYVRHRMASVTSPVVGLRYFNVYGPGESHKLRMASVAHHFLEIVEAKPDARLELFEGSEDLKRDFVYVEDVVDVVMHFLNGSHSGVFNCGSGRAESFLDLGIAVQQETGRGTLGYVPFPSDLTGKYQRYTCADLTSLRRAGYGRDFSGIREGIARFVKARKQ